LKLGFNYGGWEEGESERAEYGFAFLLVRRRHLKCAGQQAASREMRGETPVHVDVVSNSLKKEDEKTGEMRNETSAGAQSVRTVAMHVPALPVIVFGAYCARLLRGPYNETASAVMAEIDGLRRFGASTSHSAGWGRQVPSLKTTRMTFHRR
jgi:hypothetical protein